MSLINKLDILMAKEGLNKNQLSKETGIPYTTIDGFYKKGTDNVKLSTLKKLASYFNCSLDYLVDDDCTDTTNYTNDEVEILTLAAHRSGYEGKLSEEELDDIKLAIKVALARHNKI